MNTNIYPIQLLNDIHNYLPDILYNPGRFRTVQDLLDYIRLVADVNPYTRGLNAYNTAQSIRQPTRPTISRSPTRVPIPRTNINSTAVPNPELLSRLFSQDNIPVTIRTTVIDGDGVPSDLPNTNVLSSLMNLFMGGESLGLNSTVGLGLQQFLDQRVTVAPTQVQINSATIVEEALTLQEGVCTICQDQISEGDEIRRIRHCTHQFHKHCIDTWFQSNVHCPTCRHDIREIDNSTRNPPPVPANHRRTNIRPESS